MTKRTKKAITRRQTIVIAVILVVASVVGAYLLLMPEQCMASRKERKEIRVLTIGEYSSEYSPFWTWLVDSFEEETGIHVVWETKPWDLYHEKLMSYYMAGEPYYDITYTFNHWLLEIIDLLQPLDELEGFDRSEEPWATVDWPIEVAEYEWEGENHIWATWTELSIFIFWYNTELFEEEGLTEPPKTTSEVLEYAKRLTKDTDGDGAIDQYGFLMELGLGSAHREFREWWKVFGGDFQYPNSTACVNALEWMKQMMPYTDPVSWEIDIVGKNDAFQKGNIGMCFSSPTSWIPWQDPELSNVVNKTKCALLPINTTNSVETHAAGWSIPKFAEHKDWALEFLKFYCDYDTQVKLTVETGWGAVFQDPAVQEEFYPATVLAKYTTSEVGAEMSLDFHQYMGEYNKAIDTQVVAALKGEKTPKEALDDAVQIILDKGIWKPYPDYSGLPPE